MLKKLFGSRSIPRHDSAPAAMKDARVAMLLVAEADEFGHLELYYQSLRRAFAARGIDLSRHEAGAPDSAELSALAKDSSLLFFLCFNGWGANLAWQDGMGATQSFFSHFDQPLLDHFADPPFADEMQHARQFDMPQHLVLYTDHSYLAWDGLYGKAAHSSYFLPQFVPEDAEQTAHQPFMARSIDFLLPVSLYDPDHYYRQMLDAAPDRKDGQALFDELVGTFLNDARADALQWISQLWLKKGRTFDAQDESQRRVLSAAWHYVKNRRRQMMLASLAEVPLTILTKTIPYPARLHPETRVLAPRSFAEMSSLVRDARVCLCPTPHARGFHERVLLALSRGAVALSAPNQVCEEHFLDGEDMLFFQDHGADLQNKVRACAADWPRAEAIAARGEQALHANFSADVTVDRMLAIHHNYRMRAAVGRPNPGRSL